MNLIQERQIDVSKVAILFAGPPASGKSILSKSLKDVYGLIEVDPDQIVELDLNDLEKRKRANEITFSRIHKIKESGRGLIINLTGRSTEIYYDITKSLENVGYYVILIFLWLDDEDEAVARSLMRARKTDYDYLLDTIRQVNKNYPLFKRFFSKYNNRDMFVFNAFYDLESEEYEKQYNKLINNINTSIKQHSFLNTNKKTKISSFLNYISEEEKLVKFETSERVLNNFKGNLDEEILEIIKLLKKDCPDVLSAYLNSGKALYRGTKRDVAGSSLIVKGISPENRPSMSMSSIANKAIDDALLSIDSSAAIRSNSIFCTSDSDIAWSYNPNVRIIFPLQQSSTTYLRTKDLFAFLQGWNERKKVLEIFPNIEEYIKRYTPNDFITVFLKDGSNLMTEKEQKHYFHINMEAFKKHLDPRLYIGNNDYFEFIEDALNKSYEVLVHGEYYSIDHTIFRLIEKEMKLNG